MLGVVLAGLLLAPAPAIAMPDSTGAGRGHTVDRTTPRLAAKLPKAGFRLGRWTLQPVPWQDLRLNGGKPMPIKTAGPQDAKGIPMRPFGADKKLVYNPTVLAQQGMRRLDSWLQTGRSVHLRYARKLADNLDDLAVGGQEIRWQPHGYDLVAQSSGWVNANSHGLVLSFLSRFHAVTGSAGRLKDARRMLPAFAHHRGDRRWFSMVTPERLIWFEHWPDGRAVHTLNAHLNALFGLYDFWSQTGSPKAQRYFLGGVKTVREKLHRFRRKDQLSRYSLSSKAGSLHYHHTHINQLRVLARMTGDDWFARQADAFRRDERAWRAKGKPDQAGHT